MTPKRFLFEKMGMVIKEDEEITMKGSDLLSRMDEYANAEAESEAVSFGMTITGKAENVIKNKYAAFRLNQPWYNEMHYHGAR